MKRWAWIVVCLVLCGGVVFCQTLQREEFKIYSSIKNSYNNYQCVTLRVIVNRWNYDSEEMLEKIKTFYCEYEMVDELAIYLYDNIRKFERGKYGVTKVYLLHLE